MVSFSSGDPLLEKSEILQPGEGPDGSLSDLVTPSDEFGEPLKSPFRGVEREDGGVLSEASSLSQTSVDDSPISFGPSSFPLLTCPTKS